MWQYALFKLGMNKLVDLIGYEMDSFLYKNTIKKYKNTMNNYKIELGYIKIIAI